MLLCLIVVQLSSCSLFNNDDNDNPPPTPISICRGQDILSLAMQDIEMLKQALWDGQCIGAFQGTFGDITTNLDKLLLTKKVPAFRIHLGGFCGHGSKCTPGECNLDDLNCLGSRAKAFETMAKKRNVNCYLSPYAEYTSTNQAQVNGWFNIIRANAPTCILVASAMGGFTPPNILIERHGGNPGPSQITSTDGTSSFDINSPNYNTFASVISFHWTNRYNLRLTSEKETPPPPLQRSLNNRISKSDFTQLQLLHTPLGAKPAAPAQCKYIHNLAAPEIYKPHAEDYGAAGDNRSNRPMFILKTKTKNMQILSPSGIEVGCTKYYGSYTNTSLSRHYVGSCSGDDALSLYNKIQGEWGFLKDGSTCTPVAILRRMGVYR